MSTIAVRSRVGSNQSFLATSTGTAVLLGILVGLSLLVRTRILSAGFWIDEGLSVGIASHPFTEIPGLLRQDGSPPLYYLALHIWMNLFGTSEAATHMLSVCAALLAIPAAYWAASGVFGRRAAWIAAAFAALNPFLTVYAQETRMYALIVLLSVLATGAFLRAFVLRERRYLPVLALLLVLLLYTHNWSLFFVLAIVAGAAFCLWQNGADRKEIQAAALALGAVVLVFAPWVPTLLFQAAHTGAPWSRSPSPSGLLQGPAALLSGQGSAVALLLAGGSGLAAILAGRRRPEREAVLAILVVAGVTLVTAWAFSQVSPAWANRYLAVLLGPIVLLAAAALPRAGRLGLVAIALILILWVSYTPSPDKSNVRTVAQELAPALQRGDVVLSTHPEQISVLEHYLPDGLNYATPLGPVADPGVMDWRDALARLRASHPDEKLTPILDGLPEGSRIVLLRPIVRDRDGWDAPWTNLVRQRSAEWGRALAADERFVPGLRAPRRLEDTFKGMRAVVYTKMSP